MNHIRTGLYAMTAFVALMLNINWWMESALQAADWLSAEQKVAQSAARARLLSDLAMELLVSWLRLSIAVKRALAKFRCVLFVAHWNFFALRWKVLLSEWFLGRCHIRCMLSLKIVFQTSPIISSQLPASDQWQCCVLLAFICWLSHCRAALSCGG
jgi:hypothetical protein